MCSKNLWIPLAFMEMLTVLTLPSRKHSIPLQLVEWSLVLFFNVQVSIFFGAFALPSQALFQSHGSEREKSEK